ncbi:MAG: helix-turn-helix transcriptional regulator [Spirochaetales bacterium]|nr:helix-turn-helix transcriptional regulator [Spirochaetales bacterium]
MKVMTDIFSVMAAIGLANGMFVIIVLFKIKKGDTGFNGFISLIFICFTIDACWGIVFQNILRHLLPSLVHFWSPVRLLYGPILYFYAKTTAADDVNIGIKQCIHFLPFFLSLGYLLLFFSDGFTSIGNMAGPSTHPLFLITQDKTDIVIALSQFHLFMYLLRIIPIYRKYGSEHCSHGDPRHGFLRYFLFVFFAILLINLVTEISAAAGGNRSIAFGIYPALLPVIIFISGCTMLIRIAKPRNDKADEIEDEAHNRPKYTRIGLSQKEAGNYISKLNAIMEREKLYTDPNIALPTLAKKLSIPRNTLSYIINNYMGLTFYDFINKFRVEQVKELLEDPEHQENNILEIAYFSGFNSKSSFNSVFKKLTNFSPSEYRRKFVATPGSRGIDSHLLSGESRMHSVMGYAHSR